MPVLIILLIVVTGFIFEPALAILPSQADQNIAVEHDEAITASQSQPVKIGVLANRGYDIAMQEWGPTADYLNKTLFPLQFTIVPLDFNEIPGQQGHRISHSSVQIHQYIPTRSILVLPRGLQRSRCQEIPNHRRSLAELSLPGQTGPISLTLGT